MRTPLLYLAAVVLVLLATTTSPLQSQTYFPPVQGDAWESVSPGELGWCVDNIDTLLRYVERNESKAFIVLVDGRIALEWYADGFESTDNWYWASAGKVVTATLVGKLVEDGLVDIERSSQDYIGKGWTNLTDEQEAAITVRHQLTMTTGLDDQAGDPHCTDPECLVYKADPGTRWAYHNGPYTMLDGVIEGAT